MKFLRFFSLAVLGASTVLADDKPSFTISARYEGLDPAYFADAARDTSGKIQGLSTPRVTTRAGQRATIEIIKEFSVTSSTGGSQPMNCGVTLDVEPDFRDGKILLSGKSTVRRRETPADKQPLNALSFTTRETFFDGEVSDDKPLTIQLSDGVKDTSRVILTAKRVGPSKAVHASHTGTPKFRVFAVEPSPEEARKPVYMTLGITPVPTADTSIPHATDAPALPPHLVEATPLPPPEVEIRGVIDPAAETADQPESTLGRVSGSALKPLADADVPFTIDATPGPDGSILDLRLQSRAKLARKTSTAVSIYWGSDVYVTMADATRPNGRRGLLIRQE